MATVQTAMMMRRLNAADPTIVEGPRAPAKKLPATTSITERMISGADEPSAMRERLAMVGFQTCTRESVLDSQGRVRIQR